MMNYLFFNSNNLTGSEHSRILEAECNQIGWNRRIAFDSMTPHDRRLLNKHDIKDLFVGHYSILTDDSVRRHKNKLGMHNIRHKYRE